MRYSYLDCFSLLFLRRTFDVFLLILHEFYNFDPIKNKISIL